MGAGNREKPYRHRRIVVEFGTGRNPSRVAETSVEGISRFLLSIASVASPAMTTYFVECYWPGVSRAKVADAVDRLDDHRVRCLETILVTADEIVLCVVEAPSEAEIVAAASRAGLPQERVVECVQVASRETSHVSTQRGGKA